MMTRCVILFVASAALAGCNSDGPPAGSAPQAALASTRAANNPAHAVDAMFNLQVRTASEDIAAGCPVDITLTLTNVTDKPVAFIERIAELDFDTIARDDSGKEVPLTAYGRLLRAEGGIMAVRRAPVTLKPKEQVEFRLRVSVIRDMTIAGSYHIALSANIELSNASTVVHTKAEPLTVRILSPARGSG